MILEGSSIKKYEIWVYFFLKGGKPTESIVEDGAMLANNFDAKVGLFKQGQTQVGINEIHLPYPNFMW